MSTTSPVIRLLDNVWGNATAVTGRSRMRREGAMKQALRLAIDSGMPFELDDFSIMMGGHYRQGYYGGPWGVEAEMSYSLACDTGNHQAARSFEVWMKRKPYISQDILGHRRTGRLAVGAWFKLPGHQEPVKVTSFAADGSYLIATEYKPRASFRDRYELLHRRKITRDMLKPAAPGNNEGGE